MGIAAFILLIAVSLMFQFLTETFILTGVAVSISLLLVNPVLSAFRDFIPAGVHLHLTDPYTIGFLIAITVITSLLAGFYPARVLSSFLPVISLKGAGGELLNQKSYLRRSLIVFQFTIALLFIIGTGIIGDQIHFLLNQDMGFNRSAILNVYTPWGKEASDKKQVLIQKLAQLPAVSGVCKTAKIVNTAMFIAILISCMGLFGVTTFMAGQRTREIVRLLSIDFIWLVGIAVVIASPVAYYFMSRWLNDFAYRVPIHLWVFFLAGLAAVGIALATVSYQAIRAAMGNPLKNLRTE